MRPDYFLCLFSCVYFTQSAKILGIFPIPSVSHHKVFQPIWKELSLRGHDVTVITPNPLNDPNLSNLTEIDVGRCANDCLNSADVIGNMDNSQSVLTRILFCYHLFDAILEEELKQEEVLALLGRNGTFDLILVEVSNMLPLVYSFGAKYKSPIIAIASFEVFLHNHDALGNPTHPLINPDMMINSEMNHSFFNKLKSLLFNFWGRMLYYWYALPRSDRIARKYFGTDIPYLGDVVRNTSLMLLNVNPIMHGVRPNVPNIIEINQIHEGERKPLPKDIQHYLDSSPEGIVYFSLGSNIKSANLTLRTRNIIIGALSELPYNVIWKWETDDLPGKPDNVMIRKWLPQQDILAHPNIKVFVTQGGAQSIEESINHEVPIVGLPFITDQPVIIKRIVKLGMGLGLDYLKMTKSQLRDAIIEVAENKKYREQVQKSKAILSDQPMKGTDKAVWWIEYVLRHNGADHLRSPAADMSFHEYFMIDVALCLIVCFTSFMYATVVVLRTVMRSSNLNMKVKYN